MATLFLDRKETAGINSIYSKQYRRTIKIKSPWKFAVVLPAERVPKGCDSYTLHRTAAAAAKYTAKLARGKIPFIVIDDNASIYNPIISKKPIKGMSSLLTWVDGRYYGLEPLEERLVDVTVDKLR